MYSKQRISGALLALGLGLFAAVASAGPGGGKGDGGGDGQRGRRCGGTLTVVNPDGTEKNFEPASIFLDGMPTRMIEQGEKPRAGIKVDDLLARLKAARVKAATCDGRAEDFPTGLPFEGDVYVVVTGRGSLKFVKEIRPGNFINLLQDVQRLRFHAADAGDGRRHGEAGRR